jgi:hypothetical protein
MKVHKWAKEINAWANGAEIEKWMLNDTWQTESRPDWNEHSLYRIKQQFNEPQYLYVYKHRSDGFSLGLAPHPAMNMYDTTILGKIKLENV